MFNGNIKQTLWKTTSTNPAPYNPVSNMYTYTYDALNRITDATDNTTNYNVHDITYDRNGNLITLKREGKSHAVNNTFSIMDNRSYTYTVNGIDTKQLQSVNDSSGSTEGFKNGATSSLEYTYDANGNMLTDLNKGISSNITYNHFNLPKVIDFGGGDKIEYFYDATGVKLEKRVSEDQENGATDEMTQYAGNYVYIKNASAGGCGGCPQPEFKLKFSNQPEGYIEPDGSGGYDYIYQYKDHLGNIRLSYSDKDGDGQISASTEILEENNYYPFGLKHKGYNNVVNYTNIALKRTYNNREFDEALGLNVSEMNFRQYDPAIGRFNVIDRLTELAHNFTPYRFGFNNPVFYSDPLGLFETRREARQYRRDNGIRGGRIRKQDDGSFALVGANRIFQAGDDSDGGDFDFFTNDGVVESIYLVHDKSVAANKKNRQNPNYSRIMSPLPGVVPNYDTLTEHHGAADAVSVTFEFATPISFSGLHGIGFTAGVTGVEGENGTEQRGFVTGKSTFDPGWALGLSIDFTKYKNLSTEPLTVSRLEGLGAEFGVSVFFIGGSMGSDGVYRTDINGNSIMRDPSFTSKSLSFGLGIDGYINWITNTRLSGN